MKHEYVVSPSSHRLRTDGSTVLQPVKRSLSINAWIAILVIGCLITFNIQLFAIFGKSDTIDDLEYGDANEDSCQPQIHVYFSNSTGNTSSSEELWMKWTQFHPSEDRLLASERTEKNYLAIGLPVETSLFQIALASIVNHTTTYDKLHNIVILILPPNIPQDQRDGWVKDVLEKFLFEVNIGFIHIMQRTSLVSSEILSLDSSSETKLDSLIMTRSNEAERNMTLFHINAMRYIQSYVTDIADYYLHMDERLRSTPFFISAIRDAARKESHKRRNPWTVIEFASSSDKNSSLNRDRGRPRGAFLHSADLMRFVYFFETFNRYRNVSAGESTYDIFLRIVSQGKRLLPRPALFHCVNAGGVVIEDGQEGVAEEKKWKSDDPPGVVVTSMVAVGDHESKLVYASDSNYFRAQSPQPGDTLTIVFDSDDISLNRVKVETGMPSAGGEVSSSFSLPGGIIEASPKLLRLDVKHGIARCADYIKIGEIHGGVADLAELHNVLRGRPTKCLQITVTRTDSSAGPNSAMTDDVVFTQIAVYT